MRRAKPLSEVWINFERQKIDNKYMAKCKYEKQEKKRFFFYLGGFFPEKKTFFFFHGKKTIYITSLTTSSFKAVGLQEILFKRARIQ